jgi:hypothetical protein
MSYGIWKYTIVGGLNVVEMPWNARVLHVSDPVLRDQGAPGTGALWVITDPDGQPKRKYKFLSVRNGPEAMEPLAFDLTEMRYLGMYHSLYTTVFHVFDLTNQPVDDKAVDAARNAADDGYGKGE